MAAPLRIPRWGLWMMLAASVIGSVLLARQLRGGGRG
jgi:hypothetical protein